MKAKDVHKYLKKLVRVKSPVIIHAQESSQAIRQFVDPSKIIKIKT